MRLAIHFAIVALAAALLAGCGSSSDGGSDAASSTAAPKAGGSGAPAGASAQACALNVSGASGLRVTGVSCGAGQKTTIAWQRDTSCKPAGGGSQAGCTVGAYRCIATTTDRGLAVSCARPGRSIAFTAKRG
jgi:hypothetical protein